MIRRFLDRLFAIDARSLAAFRVAVGAILLVDLFIRSFSIIDHYTDAGLFPRKAWVDATADSWQWSLHAMSGMAGFQWLLLALAALAAAALILGWRTRIATVISFILLASLQQRNDLIINGGDALLRVLVFWAMFLPMGQRWSVDAWIAGRPAAGEAKAQTVGDDERKNRVLRVAGVCILLQFLLMYICSGLYKFNEVWTSGDALRRSFSFDMYVKPAGTAMLANDSLLVTASRAIPWIEIILPALCLLPFFTRWWRGLAILAFIALHMGIELTLTTGLFPWVCMTGWLLFVPAGVWDVWRGKKATDGQAPAPARAAPACSYLTDGILLFLLAYILFWNIAGLREELAAEPPLAPSHRWLGQLTTLNQKWNMFANPPLDAGWYLVTGRNGFGDEIDLLTGEKLNPASSSSSSREKPVAIYTQYPDHRWRKLMAEWRGDAHRGQWPALSHALAKRWNRTHDEIERINFIELAFMRRSTRKDGEEPAPPRKFVMHRAVVGE